METLDFSLDLPNFSSETPDYCFRDKMWSLGVVRRGPKAIFGVFEKDLWVYNITRGLQCYSSCSLQWKAEILGFLIRLQRRSPIVHQWWHLPRILFFSKLCKLLFSVLGKLKLIVSVVTCSARSVCCIFALGIHYFQ